MLFLLAAMFSVISMLYIGKREWKIFMSMWLICMVAGFAIK